MSRRSTAKECTLEEFYDWVAKTDKMKAIADSADETGGPASRWCP